VALGLAFGFWAQRLGQAPSELGLELQPRLEALEFEVSDLRRELGETQERLDFTERVLAQAQESRRLDQER
jgi:chromosome segregation ATPase